MENDTKLKNKNVETFTDDMVKAIENDRGGLIKKIIHEEEEHEALKKDISPESSKNKLFMYLSVILIALALIVLVLIVFLRKDGGIFSITPQAGPTIFLDKTEFKPIDGLNRDRIMDTLANQAENTKLKVGGVEGIYLTENKKVLGFKRFMALLQGGLSKEQLQLIGDNFLLGVVNNQETKYPFILLKVKSFSDIFPVMRAWEEEMLNDLHEFLGVEVSAETNYLFTKGFEDSLVLNKNARVLRDNDVNVVMMYIFVNDTSVIITNSEQATSELILRLFSSQIRK